MEQISTDAYGPVRHELPVISWRKRGFARFVRTPLRDAPEVLGGLDLNAMTKREAVDELADCLALFLVRTARAPGSVELVDTATGLVR